jgi:AcrR family transcriptional regulator
MAKATGVGAPGRRERPTKKLRRGALTPERIVDESMRLLDEAGVGGFSLPGLGRALGADPTAVYRHFRSKDDLVLAIADRLIEEATDGFAASDCWVLTVSDLARRLRRVYLAHPAAASLSSLRTTQRPAEIQAVEWIVGAIREAGFEGAEAALMYRLVSDFSLFWAGSEATFRSLDVALQEADTGAWNRTYRSVDPDQYPNIWSVRDELPDVSADAIYERMLEVFVTGMLARAPKGCPCPAGTHGQPHGAGGS